MNQHDLVQIVRNAAQNISIIRSTALVHAFFDGISIALSRGEKVQVPGFGIFAVTTRPARKARNPQNGEEIDVPAKQVVRFTPSKALKYALNPAPRVGGRRIAPASGERRARA